MSWPMQFAVGLWLRFSAFYLFVVATKILRNFVLIFLVFCLGYCKEIAVH